MREPTEGLAHVEGVAPPKVAMSPYEKTAPCKGCSTVKPVSCYCTTKGCPEAQPTDEDESTFEAHLEGMDCGRRPCKTCEAPPRLAAASEQPMPDNNHSYMTPIGDMVIEDIKARMAVGIQTYGTYLRPHNGRNALLDAYQEALDLACYLKQRLVEEGIL